MPVFSVTRPFLLLLAWVWIASMGQTLETEAKAKHSTLYSHFYYNRGSSSTPEERESRWARRKQRLSDQLVFNTVRRTLLADLLLGQEPHAELIPTEVRYAIHRKTALPPGIRKQLLCGKPLPPGLAKQVLPLSEEVSHYLGFRNQPNVRIGILGDHVLLYNSVSGLLYDLLADLL